MSLDFDASLGKPRIPMTRDRDDAIQRVRVEPKPHTDHAQQQRESNHALERSTQQHTNP